MAILAQGISCSRQPLLTRDLPICCVCQCLFSRCCTGNSAQQQGMPASKSSSFLFPSQPSRPPDQVAAEAIEEVHKLEAAVMALGVENTVHAKALVEALKTARAKSRVPPVSERLISCRNFLDRARKRVARAEDLIAKATEQRATLDVEVKEAEERLIQLEAEVVQPKLPSDPVVTEVAAENRDCVSMFPCREFGLETDPSVDTIPRCQDPILKSCKGGSATGIASCAMPWSLETTRPSLRWELWWVRQGTALRGALEWHEQIDFYNRRGGCHEALHCS